MRRFPNLFLNLARIAKLSLLSSLLFITGAHAKTFTFMTYNVENLFDTVHDEGKNDYTYLPLKLKRSSREIMNFCSQISNDYYRESCFNFDWSEDVLNKKIKNIAKVIKSVSPDILALEEVENKRVLKLLIERGLKGEGYKYISLIEGPDSRGIDNAIISRFPITKERIHKVDLRGVAKDTRGIMQADIRVGDKKVSVFANHWPSQSNPSKARLIAAQTLLDAAIEASQNSGSDLVIAAGDFNTVAHDNPHGIYLVIRPNFHLASEEAANSNANMGSGSHWYKGEWSFLDKVLVLKGSSNSVLPLYNTFKAFKKPWMLRDKVWHDYNTGSRTVYKIPLRFDEKTGEGFSDHLPLVMNFAY